MLVAGDHEDSAALTCKTLEAAGHRCSYVLDGRKALSWVLKQPPDALVLDLHLPGLSGVQLLEVLRSHHRLAKMSVIVVTGNPDRIDPARVQRLNVHAVLVRSVFTPADLLDAAAESALHRPACGRGVAGGGPADGNKVGGVLGHALVGASRQRRIARFLVT